MLKSGDHDDLAAQLYAAAAGDQPWMATLESLAGRFRSTACVINLADAQHRVVAAQAFGSQTGREAEYYGGETFANDPRTPHMLRVPAGTVYFDHMLYNVERMRRDRWVRQAEDILQVTYSLGVRAQTLPNGLCVTLALLSNEAEGHASDSAIADFRRLAPHIQQACALGQVVEAGTTSRAVLLDALARRAEGVLLLAVSGAITFANDAAVAILGAGDGLAYVSGGLAARRAAESRHLSRLVEQALRASAHGEAASGQALVTRPSGRRPYLVSVMAAPRTERFLSGDAVACVVHIQDLAAARLPSRDSLRSAFGLGEREMDLAIELARHAALEPAAAAAGMSLNTARNHLHSIGMKTGVRGQTQIVRLLGQLP